MRVIVLPKGEEKEFPGRRRVADVLKALDIIPETVLVAREAAGDSGRDGRSRRRVTDYPGDLRRVQR